MTTSWRTMAFALGGVAAATGVYAALVEPRWLQRTRTTLHFSKLPDTIDGLRIALLTDLHMSAATPSRLLARVVRATLADAPDLIAITGDIAADEHHLERALDHLAELSAPLGVYIVPGNHDYVDVGIGQWHEAVARRPALVDLTNRARLIDVYGRTDTGVARLCIAGVDDLAEGEPRLEMLYAADDRDFTILLAHNPDQAEHARRLMDRVDLVLSGHTHGGQVRLPGVGALVNSAEHHDLYEAGVRRRPWTQVYTSRGIGTVHLPVRFLTRPEIALLTLTNAPRPRRSSRQRPVSYPS